MMIWVKKFQSQTARCKGVELTDNQLVAALYNGQLVTCDVSNQTVSRNVSLSATPLRSLVTSNFGVFAASDNGAIVLVNSSMRRTEFPAHADYIRALAVHPTLNLLLSCSDDITTKLWKITQSASGETVLTHLATFEGHMDYIMSVQWCPKEPSRFATCSLDSTVKLWTVPSSIISALSDPTKAGQTPTVFKSTSPDCTITANNSGVNFLSIRDRDNLMLVGTEDGTATVYNYLTREVVHRMTDTAQSCTGGCFTPDSVVTLSEDGSVRIYSDSYKLVSTHPLGLSRLWCCSYSNGMLAVGGDEGVVVAQIKSDTPNCVVGNGKIWTVSGHNINYSTLRSLEVEQFEDFEPLSLPLKEIGTIDTNIRELATYPNGRNLAVISDNSWQIVTQQTIRGVGFGDGRHFVWLAGGLHATIVQVEDGDSLSIFNGSTLMNSFMTLGGSTIFGGDYLAVFNPTLEFNSPLTVRFYCPRSTRCLSTLTFEGATTIKGIKYVDADCSMDVPASRGAKRSRMYVQTDKYISVYYIDSDLGAALSIGGQEQMGMGIFSEGPKLMMDTASFAVTPSGIVFLASTLNKLYCAADTPSAPEGLNFIPQYVAVLPDSTSRVIGVECGCLIMANPAGVITAYRIPRTFDEALATGQVSTESESVTNAIERRVLANLLAQFANLDAIKFAADPIEIALKLGAVEEAFLHLENRRKGMSTLDDSVTSFNYSRIAEAAMARGKINIARQCLIAANDAPTLFLLGVSIGSPTLVSEATALAQKTPGGVALAFIANSINNKPDQACSLLSESSLPMAGFYARSVIPSYLDTINAKVQEGSQMDQSPDVAGTGMDTGSSVLDATLGSMARWHMPPPQVASAMIDVEEITRKVVYGTTEGTCFKDAADFDFLVGLRDGSATLSELREMLLNEDTDAVDDDRSVTESRFRPVDVPAPADQIESELEPTIMPAAQVSREESGANSEDNLIDLNSLNDVDVPISNVSDVSFANSSVQLDPKSIEQSDAGLSLNQFDFDQE